MSSKTPKHRLESLDSGRHNRVRAWLADQRNDQARRLLETRRIFDDQVVTMDPHTHSEHSDGSATIADNRDAGLAAGIDVVFATDHRSQKQKRSVRSIPSMSWGQEPGAKHHHIGLLCNTRLFVPKCDSIAQDIARARRLAPFVWIPHPAGWYPRKTYSEEQISALWTLAPSFAMEVINGAHKIGSAFDRFDAAAVEVWDRLLSDGIRVTPLGGSDAHTPESIGCCWTAVMAREGAAVPELIDALNEGRCMASEAALLKISVNGRPMGSTLRVSPRRRLTVRYKAADSAGLQNLSIVTGRRVRKTIYTRDATLVEGSWSFVFGGERSIRFEARSVDGRRAFSAPIYFERRR